MNNEYSERVVGSTNFVSFAILLAAAAILVAGFYISSQFEKPRAFVTATFDPEQQTVIDYNTIKAWDSSLDECAKRVNELQDEIDDRKPAPKATAMATSDRRCYGYMRYDGITTQYCN